ncbi:hypothetical protein [Alkalinema pantanalense]
MDILLSTGRHEAWGRWVPNNLEHYPSLYHQLRVAIPPRWSSSKEA